MIHTSSLNNSNGGLNATGGINVSGSSLSNSSGQIAGDQIDLALSGALSNRLGIVESGSTLDVAAASVDIQSGKLRALVTSGQTGFPDWWPVRQPVQHPGNRRHRPDARHRQFSQRQGTLLHVGTGTLSINSRQAMAAGYSLVTRGALSLRSNGLDFSEIDFLS
ncbi:adhesin HecA-like repeat protein [Pseudomonas sp. 3296]|uniref:hypothetical protein n=1 Tax=Pseudomonas sp. 3296 TaxID=2817753 RepID=UPI00285F909B|nr:hypothetical protein [Pseudomonas sp. 3296]MDR6919092.1 adhesin HecA-like repeat protein [Pseudomonas sp. 3296]